MLPLDLLMFPALIGGILAGFPVAFTIAGVAVLFAVAGHAAGQMDIALLGALGQRVFGILTNDVLIAIPLFVFMGVVLEKSRIAENLLETMGRVCGELRGGLGLSVVLVGALLAASTGIVGATVIAMGLIALPTMLASGYRPSFAAGIVCTAGTLGQIIPPSTLLIILADVMSNAYQQAQYEQGLFTVQSLSVGQLFAAALLPGLALVLLYLLYVFVRATCRPDDAPRLHDRIATRHPASAGATSDRAMDAASALATLVALPSQDNLPRGSSHLDFWTIATAIAPPILLIVAVLGAILGGVATPTEAASVGAVGAILIAGGRLPGRRVGTSVVVAGVIALIGLAVAAGVAPVRLQRSDTGLDDWLLGSMYIALVMLGLLAILVSLRRLAGQAMLTPSVTQTMTVSAMIFATIVTASMFSLVFVGLGGEARIESLLESMPGGSTGALVFCLALIFVLGFFLDFVEISVILLPLIVPGLILMGHDPLWLAVLIAINLQTSFLTPPFGFSLFYLRSVAPPAITTIAIYRGVLPFIGLQIIGMSLIGVMPWLATWLPERLF